ncbi:MAG: D-glycero-beta-D-manno-heptose 1-phosphate adenylyltransferase [candidate division NC10 bacterium]|nr:D-glycero-beta-D-manno-heptose 1-phosphate adenylyltransferase [candidate division NC10 bacterium]
MGEILSQESLVDRLRSLRQKGKKVVFTNGCFDLLHVGHVRYLQAAKKLGDVLVVALNSDRSVKAIKGARRPILPQGERAEIVAALASVDFVTIFEEEDPARLISLLRPEVLVKGADWPADQIVGKEQVEARGGRVLTLPLVAGASSSSIIHCILQRYAKSSSPRRNGPGSS